MSFIKGARLGLGKRCRQSLREFILQSLLPSASPLPGKPVMFLSSQHYCKSFNPHRINPPRCSTQQLLGPAGRPRPRPGAPTPSLRAGTPRGVQPHPLLPSPLLRRLSEFKPQVFLCETRSGAAGPAVEACVRASCPAWLLAEVPGSGV